MGLQWMAFSRKVLLRMLDADPVGRCAFVGVVPIIIRNNDERLHSLMA